MLGLPESSKYPPSPIQIHLEGAVRRDGTFWRNSLIPYLGGSFRTNAFLQKKGREPEELPPGAPGEPIMKNTMSLTDIKRLKLRRRVNPIGWIPAGVLIAAEPAPFAASARVVPAPSGLGNMKIFAEPRFKQPSENPYEYEYCC
jgi:hypothetical protein